MKTIETLKIIGAFFLLLLIETYERLFNNQSVIEDSIISDFYLDCEILE